MATLPATTEKDKKALVVQLRKTPIVQLACERAGVSRATYYRWRADDKIFARAADHAIAGGKFFINDLAESKLLQLIQGNNLTAIIFWLKNNHPIYATRVIHEYDLTCDRFSTEEQHAAFHAMIRAREAGITRASSGQKFKEYMQAEDRMYESEEGDRKKVEAYDEE
jgi:hypothetical protein